MNLFNNKITRATRYIGLTLITGLLLVSCGGGGGSQTPSTTATGIIGSSGGSITSSNGAIITIDPSVVQDGTPITVTILASPPSTSPEIAPASSQISVEIPANALSATNTAVDSGISIDIPLSDTTAGGAQAALSVAPIKTSYRYIKTQIGTTIVYGKYVTKVVSNKVVATTKITYRYAKQQVTQGNPYVINFLVNTFSPNVPTAGTLFEITGIAPNDYVDSLNPKTVVPTGKLPLVLVHGIQFGCDGNADAYKTTWEAFRQFYFSNLGQPLRDKYQLYTFSYQTDLSIKENGRLLANALKASFGALPSVVLAHSMGGLVTRSAMIHHETIGANIGGIITLGTPHHGTKTVNTVAALVDHTCFFATDSQGAKDLSWDHFDDPAYDPNTIPSINPFLVGANGINTLETTYAQNHPGYYQRLLPYAGTIISTAQAIDLPQCPNLIGKILLSKLVLPPGILRTPLYICSAADVLDYLATWDEVVPEVSARYKDYVNGTYIDKPSWGALPRTYTGIVHSSSFGLSSLYDSPWVFLENPDTMAGGISTDLLNLYGTALPALCPTGQVLQNGQCVTPPPPGSFVDNFDGTALQSAYWSPTAVAGANGVTITVSGGIADFSCSSIGPHGGAVDTNGKYTFSGDPITIEARMAGSGNYRNTSLYIVEVNNTGDIEVGDTNYSATNILGGLYTVGTGVFNLPQNGNGTSVNGYKEYRVTLSGTSLTVERGDTLANITETRTVTLGSSITGKTFFLRIGSASQPYCPAAYDWVRVLPNVGSPPPPATASTLNDTGITSMQCYQAGSDVLVDCASAGAIALNSAQDGMVGRDANAATNSNADGKLGFSFTAVADGANPNGCVQDNVTGLMWENKTTDGGLRDWNKTYTNYDSTLLAQKSDGTAPTQAEIDAPTNSVGFKNSVNTQSLCGYGDWRIPTNDELQSIVNYSVAVPSVTVDATYFPNTKNNTFWSASPFVVNPNYAWYVNYYGGFIHAAGVRNSTSYVRLVRAGQPQIATRYTLSVDGQEVTDNQTKLIWRRCAEGMNWDGATCAGAARSVTHEAALQLAATQSSSTSIAWRLPSIKELTSIANLSNQAVDSTIFPATPTSTFWSASPYAGIPTNVWSVSFFGWGKGAVNILGRNASVVVRLVRDAPSQKAFKPVVGAF